MVLVLFETMSNKMSKSRYFLAVVVVAVVVAVVFLAVVVLALALANSPQPHPPAMVVLAVVVQALCPCLQHAHICTHPPCLRPPHQHRELARCSPVFTNPSASSAVTTPYRIYPTSRHTSPSCPSVLPSHPHSAACHPLRPIPGPSFPLGFRFSYLLLCNSLSMAGCPTCYPGLLLFSYVTPAPHLLQADLNASLESLEAPHRAWAGSGRFGAKSGELCLLPGPEVRIPTRPQHA